MKMNELAAGVAQYMDEKAAKEDVEELELNAAEEGTSPPRAVPADVAEASTPPGATGGTPLLLRLTSQQRQPSLLTRHPLECTLCRRFLF